MAETSQLYLGLRTGDSESETGFQSTLNYIREAANTEYRKGELFERLMRRYFNTDPIYKERFSEVWLWKQWATNRPGFNRVDTGIDLVAEERQSGYCAIQCKCYSPNTKISKGDLDSFISASARTPFTSRIVVDTGGEWGPNAQKVIEDVTPECRVIRYGDLASRPIHWPDLRHADPETLDYRQRTFTLQPHQQQAFDDVINGFKSSVRGKLIMACGTGKTFTALKIAEHIAGMGGRVLYLVPSIALFSQTMREWADQQGVPHRYIGICSDTRAGKTDEDASLQELEIPVTTAPPAIANALQKANPTAMTVTFCTYHSLPIIETAQSQGSPAFDILICDEAHKTTGRDLSNDTTSLFAIVHDENRIHARKRLYMTATPRIYTQAAKIKAAEKNIRYYSMDDLETFGPEFHRLTFTDAVHKEKILSDFKVLIYSVYDYGADAALQSYVGKGGIEININDATKIVGCWRALQQPEKGAKPLRRTIAFTNTIAASKRLNSHWNGIIDGAVQCMPEDIRPSEFKCDTRHVDGKDNALNRKARIEWLKDPHDTECRILSNAKCLSEGIDVPALDAVIFMEPKKSHVDIVQAVGRVMRQAPGKEIGYIILPIAIPAGADPNTTLNNNRRFSAVWDVLNALRSHDESFNAEINKIDLNDSLPDRIIFGGDPIEEDENGEFQPPLFIEIPPQDIYAKIVEKCGDMKYWGSWAEDVADIFLRVIERIRNLLTNPINSALREWFDSFYEALKRSINDSITTDSAIDMMAQHILTRPVFNALFEGYDFASGNPVARALDSLRKDFAEFGLEDETRDLKPFYESVEMRARGIDNNIGRQQVLLELYEGFFKKAVKKDADRLGIVYTPVEVVDFILHSADEVLRREFGRSLSDEGVNILDPFTGTGTFLVRLIQSDIINDSDLERKFHYELHANEIVLLAYYMAAVNIEEAYRARRGEDSSYEPFNGIVLTDTFNLNKPSEEGNLFPKDWLPDNSSRAEQQEKQRIQVIVGNPPWSAGQRSASDDNPNVDYPAMERRIEETYAAHSKASLKRFLYDSYKMAIRWASDRIEGEGVIAFVTNGSWLDGNVDAGMRACLVEEFNSIYVLNLRGNQRTQGERSDLEGGKIFGSGSRAPVTIAIFVKNSNAPHDGCKIRYRDIGDNLKREEKLTTLRNTGSISSIDNWETIEPDRHQDWINKRTDAFATLYPLGTSDAKAGKTDDAIFGLYSLGLSTNRDSQIYNFTRDACVENAKQMTSDYLAALSEIKANPTLSAEDVANRHSSHLHWTPELIEKLPRNIHAQFDEDYIRKVEYRPFIATNCYGDYTFITRKGQMDRIFPYNFNENRAICVTGVGTTKPFSALITVTLPDLSFHDKSQCFPRFRYPKPKDVTDVLPGIDEKRERMDNISDTALRKFRTHYTDDTITKDMIFDYVYGVLHAPNYREEYAANLSKELPRVPFAPDFCAFAEAENALAELHLAYETCEQYPLEVKFALDGEPQPHHFRLTTKVMRFTDPEKTTLEINEYVSVTGIPKLAHRYVVNGRTPLEWYIDRYVVKKETPNITNDPNGWFADPRDLVAAIKRIVHVSVESTRIIENLPREIVDSKEG